jgi:hypothetical protein
MTLLRLVLVYEQTSAMELAVSAYGNATLRHLVLHYEASMTLTLKPLD